MKRLLVVLVWLHLATRYAAAQERPLECGTLETNDDDVAYVAKYFISETFAGLRQGHIERVRRTEPSEVVTDSAVCDAVHDAAVRQLGIQPSTTVSPTPGNYDFTVFRFGDYYAIVLLDVSAFQDATLVAVSGLSPILVFRRSNMSYVFRFAI